MEISWFLMKHLLEHSMVILELRIGVMEIRDSRRL